MIKILTKPVLALALLALAAGTGCHKKLDLFPVNDITSETVFRTPLGYRQALAKIYQGLAVTDGDIPGQIVSDEGNTGFLRQLWYLQSLTTDEAAWTYFGNTDPIGIHQMQWNAGNQTIAGLYYRCFYMVTLCNNYISESTPAKVSGRGISGADAATIATYQAEARFVRAYMYAVLLDAFGSVPFTDETYVIGSGVLPQQKSRADLFKYVEDELKAIETLLPAPRTNENGRVDQGAAWALLSRLYLNAEVYTGTARWQDCVTYSYKVISAGYALHNDYRQLMLADNHLLTATEFIWTLRFDGTSTQTFSGTTFLVHAPAGVPGSVSGTNGTWDCTRIPEQFVDKFNSQDVRGQFWTATQSKSMDVLLGDPRSGYSSIKFRNVTRTGERGPNTDAGGTFVDVDFPVFRLAEVYLNYAEATLRGGAASGGNSATAIGYLRQLATRARPTDANAAASAELTLPYLIDERGRELFWECTRRTDLVRFGQFTTATYLWDWKGGARNGAAVAPTRNIFPIPSIDISSNPNLRQNPGY